MSKYIAYKIGVKASEQLLCDNQNLRPLADLDEVFANLFFTLRIEMPLLEARRIVVAPVKTISGILRRQDGIKRLLVKGARFTIHGHKERFVAERLHVLPEVVRHVTRHLFHPVPALEKVLQVHRAFENLVQLLNVGDALSLGQREELLLHDLVRHEHLVRREVVVERQRRAVLDALGDGILVEITLVVLAAESFERPLAVGGLVHWRAREAEETRVRQASHQKVAQVATCRTMRFINEYEDVRAQIQVRWHVAKLVDHRHDDAPVILPC